MKTQTTRMAPKQPQRNEPQNGRLALIQQRAYERYLQRGMEPGFELEDWLQAERELSPSPAAGKRPEAVQASA